MFVKDNGQIHDVSACYLGKQLVWEKPKEFTYKFVSATTKSIHDNISVYDAITEPKQMMQYYNKYSQNAETSMSTSGNTASFFYFKKGNIYNRQFSFNSVSYIVKTTETNTLFVLRIYQTTEIPTSDPYNNMTEIARKAVTVNDIESTTIIFNLDDVIPVDDNKNMYYCFRITANKKYYKGIHESSEVDSIHNWVIAAYYNNILSKKITSGSAAQIFLWMRTEIIIT